MRVLHKNNFTHLIVLLLIPLFFYLGYVSKDIFGWNYDIFFAHSFLIFIVVSIFILIDFAFSHSKLNKYIRLINILIISCSLFGIALAIIQNDMINTRWLELGRFAVNDATDYIINQFNIFMK